MICEEREIFVLLADVMCISGDLFWLCKRGQGEVLFVSMQSGFLAGRGGKALNLVGWQGLALDVQRAIFRERERKSPFLHAI